jgi:hypothetical protein
MTEVIEDEELIYEEPERPSEIITSAVNSLSVCEFYDYGMASKEEKEMIDDIKRMALILVHISFKSIYEANIEE